MANKKVVRGEDTKSRITACWDEVSSNPADRPTVKEFCKRVSIAPVTFYRFYPDWAEKVRLRRDKNLERSRRLSPKAQRLQEKENEAETITLVLNLRAEVKSSKQELQAMTKDRDRWAKKSQEGAKMKEMNERLRGVILLTERVLRKHIDHNKAQAILAELDRLSGLNVITGDE